MDRLFGWVVPFALRRGFRGQPVWLAVGLGFWLARRSRRRQQVPAWSAVLEPGQGIVISTFDPLHPVSFSEPGE